MSRSRDDRDPFWATAISRMQPGPAEITRQIRALMKRSGFGLWPGSGYRTGSVEHSSGTSTDWMITELVGMRPTAQERAEALTFVDWLIRNRHVLDIEGILFSRDGKPRTEAIGYSKGWYGWRALTDRGSVSANHIDHVHIKFRTRSRWASALSKAVLVVKGGTTKPTTPSLPSTGADGWDGKSFPHVSVFRPGRAHPAVKLLQQRLVAHGYAPGEIDSYWGTRTSREVQAFQHDQGWTGDDADGIPGAVTWQRLMSKPKAKVQRWVVTTKSEPLLGLQMPRPGAKILMRAQPGAVLSIVRTSGRYKQSVAGHWYHASYLTRA